MGVCVDTSLFCLFNFIAAASEFNWLYVVLYSIATDDIGSFFSYFYILQGRSFVCLERTSILYKSLALIF